MRNALLLTGGIINILIAALHIAFWPLLNWHNELQSISRDTAAILQVENIIIIFMVSYFSIMSFVLLKNKKPDIFARSIVLCIIGFYAIRLIAGYPLFGFSIEEMVIWIICIVLITAYTSILLIKAKA
jgi:hypothetical protein